MFSCPKEVTYLCIPVVKEEQNSCTPFVLIILHTEQCVLNSFVLSSVANPSALNFSSIEPLNGSNFKKWKEDVIIVLGLMDFDLALREEEPAAITEESSAEQKQHFGKWEKANRMALLIMKRAMSATIRGGIPTCEKAKDFLEAVEAKFKESDKAETGNLMTKLTTLKYDGTGSVREHIMRMIDVSQKLKDLEVPIDDNFLVHMALNSLPPKYAQIKVSYNTQKDKWSLDDLISICAQEENRLKDEKTPVVYLVHAGHHGKKKILHPLVSHPRMLLL